jgi:hypothetical protein
MRNLALAAAIRLFRQALFSFWFLHFNPIFAETLTEF